MNPYLCEVANIHEYYSRVHGKGEATTHKAADIVRSLTEKIKRNRPLVPIQTPITKEVLVIGGGIVRIQTSLDIASYEHQVILIEKEPSIGEHMS